MLARLTSGTHRFNELLRQIDGVSRRMLSATLRQLERDGLVLRHVYARVPARVEYELSDTGEALLTALAPLLDWGKSTSSRSPRRASASTGSSSGARPGRRCSSRTRRASRGCPASTEARHGWGQARCVARRRPSSPRAGPRATQRA